MYVNRLRNRRGNEQGHTLYKRQIELRSAPTADLVRLCKLQKVLPVLHACLKYCIRVPSTEYLLSVLHLHDSF